MDINGSVAVITGGASGIGAQVAKDLAKGGAKVVVGDVNEEGLKSVVAEITEAGGQAAYAVGSVTEEADVEALMEKAVSEYGAINFVFANAGIFMDSLFINVDKTGKVKTVMSTDAFRKVVDVNLVGAFLTIREGVRRMIDNGWPGVVVITSSINGTGQPGQLNYSSTKAALNLWPKVIAGELNMRGVKNIRIAGIAPGYAATPILLGMNQEALTAILSDVHVGRLIEPAELSSTVQHIIENEAIDATIIEVTGGVTYGPRQRAK